MLRQPNNDSIVYKILIALQDDRTVLLMNEYTLHMEYNGDTGRLKLITPIRIIINRMFKLVNETHKQLTADVEVFEQEYVLDSTLRDLSNDLEKLKVHYESEYLNFG